MLKFRLCITITITSIWSIYAQSKFSDNPDFAAKLAQVAGITVTPQVLCKSSATARTSYTNYTNTDLNFSFVAPQGWSFVGAVEDTNIAGIVAQNPLYSAKVLIIVYDCNRLPRGKTAPVDIATIGCFGIIKVAYNASIYGTLATGLIDTFYTASSLGEKCIVAEYGTNWANLGIEFDEYNSHYDIEVSYWTTTADYTLNNAAYFQVVSGANFIKLYSAGVAKNSIVPASNVPPLTVSNNRISLNTVIQRNVKLEMYDLIGRRVSSLYNGNVTGTHEVQMGSTVRASNTYILQLKMDCDKYAAKYTNAK